MTMENILPWFCLAWWLPGIVCCILVAHQYDNVRIGDVIAMTIVAIFIGPFFTFRYFIGADWISRTMDTVVLKKVPYKSDEDYQ